MKNSDFVWVELTLDEMLAAFEMQESLPKKMEGNYSGDKPAKRTAGYVGQIAAAKYFGGDNVDNVHYDLLINGKRCEVKTSTRNANPRPEYWARIAASNDSQLCDYYVFCQTQWQHQAKEEKLMHGAHILGVLAVEEMRGVMHFMQKGEIEPGDVKPELGSCWKIACSDLVPPQYAKLLFDK